jgi:hypothetical protein
MVNLAKSEDTLFSMSGYVCDGTCIDRPFLKERLPESKNKHGETA